MPRRKRRRLSAHEGGPQRKKPVQQPSTLRGLLILSTEAAMGCALHYTRFPPMSQERKKFLAEALKTMTTDILDIFNKEILIYGFEKYEDDADIAVIMEILNLTTFDFIDHEHMVIRNNFQTLTALHFAALYPCMNSCETSIRARSCELLAVLLQNNPYCQQIAIDHEFIPNLLKIIYHDEDIQVVFQALIALSSAVRDNVEGFNQLIHHNGLSILQSTLKKKITQQFITRAMFLLSALCNLHPHLKNRLVFHKYIPTLIQLISYKHSRSHEHVLSLLVMLVEEGATAVAECRNAKYNLKEILQRYLINISNKDEYILEREHCNRLLQLLFSGA